MSRSLMVTLLNLYLIRSVVFFEKFGPYRKQKYFIATTDMKKYFNFENPNQVPIAYIPQIISRGINYEKNDLLQDKVLKKAFSLLNRKIKNY